MTIAGKRYKLDKYCSDTTCSQCIFNKGAEGCKYHFLDDEDCIKAYDELMAYKKNVGGDIMTIEEKRDYLNDYCNGTFCSECIFRGEDGCKCGFANKEECEKAYDKLKKYETKDETSYWEIDGYGILTADESMTKLIEFIIEKKLNYSDFHKAFLVNL